MRGQGQTVLLRLAGLVLAATAMMVATLTPAQTISRVVTHDGRVIYTDHPELVDDPMPQSRRDLSQAQLSGTNALDAVGSDPALRECQADATRYCFGRQGEQRVDCLVDHQKQVSDACFLALKRKVSGHSAGNDPRDNADAPLAADTRQACSVDLPRYCANVASGGGHQLDCLIAHQKEISDGCYDELSRVMKQP